MFPFSVLLLLVVLSLTDAKVEFTSSTMYDIFDFQGADVIRLPRCNNGCLIYASTMGDWKTEDGLDPYMKSVTVFDPATNTAHSIAEIAMSFDKDTSQKIPLDLAVAGDYSILNLNPHDVKGWDVAVWVVEKDKVQGFDYEIYDAAAMKRVPAIPSQIVTIMSAAPFTVIGRPKEANAFKSRLVGFDNAYDKNPDLCRSVFEADDIALFDGYEFQVMSPIISLAFASNKNSVDFTANYNYINIRRMAKPGFIASPGYNGCDRLDRNQVYHSTAYHYSEQIDIHGEPDFYQVVFNTLSDIDQDHSVDILDITGGDAYTLKGADQIDQFVLPEAQIVAIQYKGITSPQSFLLQYTSLLKGSSTTSLADVTPTTSAVSGVNALISALISGILLLAR